MTRPITAGVDGTPESHAARAWAVREAVRRDLPLRVVHAWQLVPDQAFRAASRETHDQWVREGVDEAARSVAERHPDADPDDLAYLLLTIIRGIDVVGAYGHSPARLTSIAESAFASLPRPRHH